MGKMSPSPSTNAHTGIVLLNAAWLNLLKLAKLKTLCAANDPVHRKGLAVKKVPLVLSSLYSP
jgi:hypothetical protein